MIAPSGVLKDLMRTYVYAPNSPSLSLFETAKNAPCPLSDSLFFIIRLHNCVPSVARRRGR